MRGFLVRLLVMGCLFLQGCSEAVREKEALEGSPQRIVDATIEFVGPSEKWVGPQSFMVHVSISNSQDLKISIFPSGFSPVRRVHHSQTQGNAHPALTADDVREVIARLSTALDGTPPAPFVGCLSPIRLRLIRADGFRIERQGCRGVAGWPRQASEAASRLVETAMTHPELLKGK